MRWTVFSQEKEFKEAFALFDSDGTLICYIVLFYLPEGERLRLVVRPTWEGFLPVVCHWIDASLLMSLVGIKCKIM